MGEIDQFGTIPRVVEILGRKTGLVFQAQYTM